LLPTASRPRRRPSIKASSFKIRHLADLTPLVTVFCTVDEPPCPKFIEFFSPCTKLNVDGPPRLALEFFVSIVGVGEG
jgi:hypothetical protein